MVKQKLTIEQEQQKQKETTLYRYIGEKWRDRIWQDRECNPTQKLVALALWMLFFKQKSFSKHLSFSSTVTSANIANQFGMPSFWVDAALKKLVSAGYLSFNKGASPGETQRLYTAILCQSDFDLSGVSVVTSGDEQLLILKDSVELSHKKQVAAMAKIKKLDEESARIANKKAELAAELNGLLEANSI